MNEKLNEIRLALRNALEEDDKIGQMAANAQREVDNILANGKPGDELESRAYATAALTLQMLPSRRAHVAKVLKAVQHDAVMELRAAREVWNNRVAKKKKEVFGQACEALRPFFTGGLSGLEAEANKMNIPALYKVGQAWAHPAWRTEPKPADILKDVELFLAHVKRQSELIGSE